VIKKIQRQRQQQASLHGVHPATVLQKLGCKQNTQPSFPKHEKVLRFAKRKLVKAIHCKHEQGNLDKIVNPANVRVHVRQQSKKKRGKKPKNKH